MCITAFLSVDNEREKTNRRCRKGLPTGEGMSKFRDEDYVKLFALAEETKKEGGSLGGVFAEVAGATGLAKGSVRNLYYKKLREKRDGTGKSAFLNGSGLTASRVLAFPKEEARDMAKKILIGAGKGKSVRRTISELAYGNEKVALRYQNKFRNMVKNEKPLMLSLIGEVRREHGYCFDPYDAKRGASDPISLLKSGIDSLCKRLTENAEKENEFLKATVQRLSRENADLKLQLKGLDGKSSPASVYFENVDSLRKK